MDSRRYTVLLLQSLHLAHLVVTAPPGQTRQYCHNEVFRAECSSGHVVLVTSALYGRMSLGRCVKTDFGFIGCKVDVIEHLHSRCSGRRVCNVRVPDSTLDRAKPCNEDLKSYLEVAYSCAQVVKPDPSGGCILKSSDDEVDGPLLGYLAEVSSRGRRQRGHVTCGTQQSPWLVAARPGQRLRFTLMDFTTTSSDAPLDVNHDDVAVQSQTIALRHANDVSMPRQQQQQQLFGACLHLFASVFDLATNRTAKICGGSASDVTMTSSVYTTHGSRAAVVVHSVGSSSRSAPLAYFLIKYESVGCADYVPDNNPQVWTQRFGLRLQLGCVTSSVTWQMFCVDGRWQGPDTDCSTPDANSADTPPAQHLHELSIGTAAVVIVLVTLIIALLVSTVGIFWMHRSWRAKLAREASIARMKELDSYGLVDDSFSLADVVRNSTNERACRSVQSKSYDVMYCTAKSNRNDAVGCKSLHDLRSFYTGDDNDVHNHVTADHVVDDPHSWYLSQPYHTCTLPCGHADVARTNDRVPAYAVGTGTRLQHVDQRCAYASTTEDQRNRINTQSPPR